MLKKRVGILGSTGSIGSQSIDVILNNIDNYEVVFLTAHNNEDILKLQQDRVKAKYTILTSENDSKNRLISILDNEPIDIVIHAVSGIEGVESVYNIVSRGIDIALANKESVVTAGKIITNKASHSGSKIIPVDSEHSAIFQSLMGQDKSKLDKITLTASGGPFRQRPKDALDHVSLDEALKHPNWSMGQKISIDSSTMMNKGLELIEARYLFDIKGDKLDIIIHPESIIHSYVTFKDGSSIAQMGLPDMRVPISFALGYPNRINSHVAPIDLGLIKMLTFEKPDLDKFKCLDIAYKVLKEDSNALMIAMNSANEVAVKSFLMNKIAFKDIPNIIEETLNRVSFTNAESIEEALCNTKISYDIAVDIIDKLT